MPRSAEQLEAGAVRCANALFARGVARGDAIGVALADGDTASAVLRACTALGSPALRVALEPEAAALRDAVALVHERRSASQVATLRRALPKLRVALSVDDGSGADLTQAGSEDFGSALAGAPHDRFHWTKA
jgi:hypothetical protein